jgi:endoglucanase
MINKRIVILNFLLLFCFTAGINAQLTPQDAIKAMGRGINLGNTLEPPDGEGTWGNAPVQESNFDDYKNAGFTCVRLPITWDKHTGTASPYTINSTWLNRIEQIVDWGLSRKLIIIINAHHDGWIKNNYTPENVIRFDSIWSQIATRFKDKSDSLLFEVINEPYPMTLEHVNELNARIIKTIRKTNPTRIVLFSGHMWSNSQELVQAEVPDDDYLIGYYHSYDPYPFGLEGPGTYGSDADIDATVKKFEQVSDWGAEHNLPVVLSEFGYTYKCEYNSRMCAYATVTEKAQLFNVAFNVWEDGGDFKFYNRAQHTWTEIKDILIHTYRESPNKMQINNIADTLVQLQWTNRTNENDSIVIERRINDGSFEFLKKVSPETSAFIDSSTRRGTTYYYRLKANLRDSIEIQSYPIRIENIPDTPEPYSGSAIPIPGTIEDENFDLGIEGETYHDSDPLNQGGVYRPGAGVDIYKTGTIYYVGSVEPEEWLDFTITVAEENDYNITAYVGAEVTGGQFELQFANDTSTPFTAEASGKMTTFNKIANTCHLAAGEQKMRLYIIKTPEFTLHKLVFSTVSSVDERSRETISVFPNPSINKVTITGVDGSATVCIYNVSGILVRTTVINGNRNSVSLDLLEDGLYYLKCFTGSDTFCEPILVMSGMH